MSGGDDWPIDDPTTSSNVYFNRDIFSPYYIRAEERLAAGQDNATNFNGSWHGSFLDGNAKRQSSTILGKDFKYGGDYSEVEPLIDLPRRIRQGLIQVQLDVPTEREGLGTSTMGQGQLLGR